MVSIVTMVTVAVTDYRMYQVLKHAEDRHGTHDLKALFEFLRNSPSHSGELVHAPVRGQMSHE